MRRSVLILVLVEDGLGDSSDDVKTSHLQVLILVLVEDGLGGFDNYTKNTRL